jgi:hypothetical protein
MVDEYRRFRKAERELRQTMDDLLKRVEALRERRAKKGRQRFEQLVGVKRTSGKRAATTKPCPTPPSAKSEDEK